MACLHFTDEDRKRQRRPIEDSCNFGVNPELITKSSVVLIIR